MDNKSNTKIIYFDVETRQQTKQILDTGALRWDGLEFHNASTKELVSFLAGAEFICGHNVLQHDLVCLAPAFKKANLSIPPVIDTIYFSPLLWPTHLYHHLPKDDKQWEEESNNPLLDAIKAKDLFLREVEVFQKKDKDLQTIFYNLLAEQDEFKNFFVYLRSSGIPLENTVDRKGVVELVRVRFNGLICEKADLEEMIRSNPVELAYCLALINCRDPYSIIPRWVLKSFPQVESLLYALRNTPCSGGCSYCHTTWDIKKKLEYYFHFKEFRKYGDRSLQEEAVQAAIHNESLLVVFPTGGGKSLTFQLPALMAGEASKGLTVVISPLQSLMKDQIDNLLKNDITEAVTINGLLNPIERAKSFEKVEDGSATLLYISPESLRSRSIEKLLENRNVVRFVIDEAHCFSVWGHDFRVDYLYIGDFLRKLQEKRGMKTPIPVSCFTATAKQKVVDDICTYFKEKLNLKLTVLRTDVGRTNLTYEVFSPENEERKFFRLRQLLVEHSNDAAIVYVSRTRRAEKLARKLCDCGIEATPYHGKMEQTKKTENQNEFIAGHIRVMVATSAFGMGVDKKDVKLVVHYDISDSLENYVQEAGRAGRDEKIKARCCILFNEDDLNKHFILLNQTRLHLEEIKQVWKAVKQVSRYHKSVAQSALEFARKAGWDDTVPEIETRVKTALSTLEEAGYLKREQNEPCVYANSILSSSANAAIEQIHASKRFTNDQRVHAVRIIKKLFSVKRRKENEDEIPESRVDYISDQLGIVKEEVIEAIQLLREEKILADAKDLTAFISLKERGRKIRENVRLYNKLDNFLVGFFDQKEKTISMKELLSQANEALGESVTPDKLKTLINFWGVRNWLKRRYTGNNRVKVTAMALLPRHELESQAKKRHKLSGFILDYLYEKVKSMTGLSEKQEVLVEFSILKLKEEFESQRNIHHQAVTGQEVEDALFYLSRINALRIDGGFMVVYNKLRIKRIQDLDKRVLQSDYKKLGQFYESKVQQIHIVGEYARKMLIDPHDAELFVSDYFKFSTEEFLKKYFKGKRKEEIVRTVTPGKYVEIIEKLSGSQSDILTDSTDSHIVVAAGPGSGKTKVLVHKLASLLLLEGVKHEQLLMLTFSRAATMEFHQRLRHLIGNAVGYVEIKTFHSYCFDLLGTTGNLDKAYTVVKDAAEKIRSGEVEVNRITKTVLVIDEAQDMHEDEFALVEALMQKNEGMKVIAVGDDDQDIFRFRKNKPVTEKVVEVLQSQEKRSQEAAQSLSLFDMSEENSVESVLPDVSKPEIQEEKEEAKTPVQITNSMEKLLVDYDAKFYELLVNYRSKQNLVQFSNEYACLLVRRLKSNPVQAYSSEPGTIRVVEYLYPGLEEPLTTHIVYNRMPGTTCVLTETNEEAKKVNTLLNAKGCHARLIQDLNGFGLDKIDEIFYFTKQLNILPETYILDEDGWQEAKHKMLKTFSGSTVLELCLNMVETFERIYPEKKYRSDWEMFLEESELEDFYTNNADRVLVSTIHKAKGKEFDNVYLLLNPKTVLSEERKRRIYVAITRAKNHLEIHYNGSFFRNIRVPGLDYCFNKEEHPLSTYFSIYMGLRDIALNSLFVSQKLIEKLRSGDALVITKYGCALPGGRTILEFSKSFNKTLAKELEKGYYPTRAIVNFIVYWTKKEEGAVPIRIVLPEITFKTPSVP